MRSSSGKHFVGLDHVRAFAAFTVFSWHFLHINNGHMVPHQGVFTFPLNALFSEGQTGVAIFMVLSGYLFAKITDGKKIIYREFLYNRFIRLAPLLIAVFIIKLIVTYVKRPQELDAYLHDLLFGFVLPGWPNGGWSITAEMHFYLVFPLIMLAETVRRYSSLVLILISVATRVVIYLAYGAGDLQHVAYFTIIGRVDQFVLGILFYRYGGSLAGRHRIGVTLIVVWVLLWHLYDRIGGFYGNTDYRFIWLFVTTLEGLFYGGIIAWYDRSFAMPTEGVSGVIGKIGEASYSIYLLHFFFVDRMSMFVDAHIVKLTNFYVAMVFNVISFAIMSCIAYGVYAYFEKAFLRKRHIYLRN